MFTYSHPIVQQDLNEICRMPLSEFGNSTILITGANGQIATYIIYSLMYQVLNQDLNFLIHLLLVLNSKKLPVGVRICGSEITKRNAW